jgi:hypothetical protein
MTTSDLDTADQYDDRWLIDQNNAARIFNPNYDSTNLYLYNNGSLYANDPYSQVANLSGIVGNRNAYVYVPGNNGAFSLYPVQFVSYASNTGLSTWNWLGAVPPSNPALAGAYFMVGVNSYVITNRYFSHGPDTLTRFAEFHAHVPGVHTALTLGFEVDAETPNFSDSLFVTTTKTYDLIRTIVPLQQRRGRWAMAQVQHSTPLEFFQLSGMSWVTSDIHTFRTKVYNNG